MKSIYIMIVTALLINLPVAAQEKTAAPEPEIETKSSAPKAEPLTGLKFLKGKPVKIEDDKVYVVEFWATWCPPCRTTIPHLTEIQKQYKDKGVTVIGVSDEQSVETVENFIKEQGDKMDYTVALDLKGTVTKGYMRRFKQNGIPTAFIVDQSGRIAWYGHPIGEMDAVLEKVVAGNFDPVAYAKEKAEREALEKKLHQLFEKYFSSIYSGTGVEQARPTAEEIIKIGHAEALNMLAWQMLTNPNANQRDPIAALKAAEKANTQTNGENPMVLETYALALFQNKKVAEAIVVQEKTIAMVSDNERMQADMKVRLEEFKKALNDSKQ